MKKLRYKKPRKRRTTGKDMCPGCYAFNCDPMTMSRKFDEKVRRRLRAGQCPACGHEECTCKSSMSAK